MGIFNDSGIYKGPGFYKTGANGGGEKIYLECYIGTSNIFLDSINNRLNGINYYSNLTIAPIIKSIPFLRENDWEISISFDVYRKTSQGGGASAILFGGSQYYNNVGGFSIDFNEDSNSIVFLAPNPSGWGNVNYILSIVDERINYENLSKKNTVKVFHKKNTDEFTMNFLGKERTKILNNDIYYGTMDHYVGGIYNNKNSLINGIGNIYLDSYVKINGEII